MPELTGADAGVPGSPRPKGLVVTVLLILAAIAGFGAGYSVGSSGMPLPGPDQFEAGRQAGLKEAQQRLVDRGLIPDTSELSDEISSFTATIDAISGSALTVTASLPTNDPLDPVVTRTVTVNLGRDTKLTRENPKSPEEIAADEAAYAEALKGLEMPQEGFADEPAPPAEPLPPPSHFVTETITAGELEVGQRIVVELSEPAVVGGSVDADAITVTASATADAEGIPPESAAPVPPPAEDVPLDGQAPELPPIAAP